MSILLTMDAVHLKVRQNRWLWFFTIFTRIVLALGFLPSGFVKINDERFTALATTHPMGSYLEAFYHTGFYYPFVGIMQITAAILLLIPRTATLGVLIYFPIILNICLLSFAVRFDGSLLTSPLMVLACVYLLCWDWHKLKFIFFPTASKSLIPPKRELNKDFPFRFFGAAALPVIAVIGFIIFMNTSVFMPRNDILQCKDQCAESTSPEACLILCDCLHTGRTYNHCMEDYKVSVAKDEFE